MITYPLNEIDYDAADAELFHCTRNSGIYAGTDFQPTVTGADNIVTIGAGIGWIRNAKFSGKVIAEKTSTAVNMGVADASLPRIDVVCARFDKNANETTIVAKSGVPASSPVMPAISQTETLYELYFCSVYRKAGAVSIASADVTDLRLDPTVCGLMADSVTTIDTTGINAQINALIEELREEIAGVESSAEIMLKSVYDTDNDGIVNVAENALALNGVSVDEFAQTSGASFTGAVNFDASTYMRNGVFYNSYNADNTACCVAGVSRDDDLCIGATTYPHKGDTVVISPKKKIILRAGENGGGTPASVYLCAEGATSTTGDYRVLRWTTLGYERGYLQCVQDDVSMLGGPNHHWKNVYATNAEIQTSDRNAKTNIQDIDDKYVQLFDLVRPVTYQLIKGDRLHTGFIAQEVEEAMEQVGLTAEEVGFFCKDIKTETKGEEDVPVLDENGNTTFVYSLRYTEYIAIMAEKVRRLEAKYNEKIEQLEAKLAELENKL